MPANETVIKQPVAVDPGDCEAILRSLPEWFGIEDALLQYVADTQTLPTLTATRDNKAVGFLCLKHHSPASAEIHVLAVHRDARHRGIGRQLLTAAEDILRQQGIAYLHVKTLSADHPDPHYAQTRCFYESQRFLPLAELPTLWGAEQPCLMMLKRL